MADVVEMAAVVCRLFLLRQQVVASALPLLDEAGAVIGEGGAQGLGNRDQGVVEALAEGERQHKLPALPEIDLAGQGDVAIRRQSNSQSIRNSWARSCQPSVVPTYPQERRRNGTEAASTSQVPPLCAVSTSPQLVCTTFPLLPRPPTSRCGASNAKSRSLESRSGSRLQAGVDQHAVLMGVGDDFLDDAVASLGIDIGDAITQRSPGPGTRGRYPDVVRHGRRFRHR